MNTLLPAIIGFSLASLVFVIVGLRTRRKVTSINRYFIFPRSADSAALFSSFMAGSLSIASAILVFIEWSSTPGIGVAAVYSPLLWALGVGVLYFSLTRLWPYLSRYNTLHGFIQHNYGGKHIRQVAAIATITGFLGQFGVEILLGTAVVTAVFATPSLLSTVTIGAAILLVVISYSWMGGFLSVLRSDRVQYLVVLSGLGLALLYVISGDIQAVAKTLHASIATDLANPQFGPGVLSSWALVLSLFCLNVPLLITDMSIWQRLCCARDEESARKGVRAFIIGLALVGTTIILFGMALQAKGVIPGDSNDPFLGRLIGFISGSFPVALLFYAGVFAAVMSTADSFLLAAAQAWMTDVRQVPSLLDSEKYERDEEVMDESEHRLLVSAKTTTLVIGVATFAVCFTLNAMGIDYISMLFVVFAAQISLTPCVVVALLKGDPEDEATLARYRSKAVNSIVAGYATAIGLLIFTAIASIVASGEYLSFYTLYLAPIYVLAVSWIAFAMTPQRKGA